MMTETKFDAAAYWEDRLAGHWGLNAVGSMDLGANYNDALYWVKGSVFRRTVRSVGIDLPHAKVLDIGSGTGFVLRQWQKVGASKVMGSDITAFAAAQLGQQFPYLEIRQMDIGGELPQDLKPETFDCISALDVLYHIVEDNNYRQALQNIGSLLKAGGYFFLADNFLHGPTQRGIHQVSHSLFELTDWLNDAGLRIERRIPQYVLMNHPVDSQSVILHWWWGKLQNQVQRSPRRGLLLGRLLAPLEIALTQVLRESPTTELAICRK